MDRRSGGLITYAANFGFTLIRFCLVNCLRRTNVRVYAFFIAIFFGNFLKSASFKCGCKSYKILWTNRIKSTKFKHRPINREKTTKYKGCRIRLFYFIRIFINKRISGDLNSVCRALRVGINFRKWSYPRPVIIDIHSIIYPKMPVVSNDRDLSSLLPTASSAYQPQGGPILVVDNT